MRKNTGEKAVLFGLVVLVLAFSALVVHAGSVPQLVNYQGRLTDSTGAPLTEGSTVDLTFSFYGAKTGSTQLYITVVQEDVVVGAGGLYNVLIGSDIVMSGSEKSLSAMFKNQSEVWMGVKVDSDPEMTPRARITSAPYAMSLDTRFLGAFLGAADYDGDGYLKTQYASIDPDCNDGDSSIHSYATEVCDDGYDNDCDGHIDYEDTDCQPSGMALVPAGCFEMGDVSDGCTYGTDECPVHEVCITSDFFMDVHEVTNAEYAACVDANSCTAPSDSGSNQRASYYGNSTYDNFPVLYINWEQARDYCAWAGKRLPSEAEWEYAARGGLSGKRYPNGDTLTGSHANYLDSGDPWDNDTSEVGYFPANGYGIYDMAGNAREWVQDWYQSDYYSVSPKYDPTGPDTGTYRVFRGGSWYNDTYLLRVAERSYLHPTMFTDKYTGFRCARD